MTKDYSDEIKKEIKVLIENGFEFGKSERYLKHRVGISFKEMEEELNNCRNLIFTEKRETNGEERYTLYFVYTKRKGRAYAVTFRNKIRIITAFPLGKRTLIKYNKQRFKKSKERI
ncbi:MAG: hypothetical protein ABIJ58_01710 [Nanoarchaeota archaeon]